MLLWEGGCAGGQFELTNCIFQGCAVENPFRPGVQIIRWPRGKRTELPGQLLAKQVQAALRQALTAAHLLGFLAAL